MPTAAEIVIIEVVGGSITFKYDGVDPWRFRQIVEALLGRFPWHDVRNLHVHRDVRGPILGAIAMLLDEEYGDAHKNFEWWRRAHGENSDAVEERPPVSRVATGPIPEFLR